MGKHCPKGGSLDLSRQNLLHPQRGGSGASDSFQRGGALRLVFAMPGGPGVIEEEVIAELAADVLASVTTFLLTSVAERGFRTALVAMEKNLAEGVY